MKITVVVDNNVPFNTPLPLRAEHGVSFLIDTGDKRVLYDTGQTGAVLQNLTTLGVPPTTIDAIVLSHGHYDHTGGLQALLEVARKDIPIFVHSQAFSDRYSVRGDRRRPIGIPFAKNYIESLGGRWRLTDASTEVVPGIWFSGSIPRITDFETGDTHLKISTDAGDTSDSLEDDTVLYCAGSRGLVTISGCAHSGLVNAVRHGFNVIGQNRLQGWIGGTHLGPVSEEQQNRTISQLMEWNPDFIAANHCTGFAMMSRLQHCFGTRFIPAFVGESIAID